MTQEREPLWRVMHDAYWEAAGCSKSGGISIPPPSPDCNAAEIRALRDWLVPEEESPYSYWHPVQPGDGIRWQERQRLRALLTAEAERAEKGG